MGSFGLSAAACSWKQIIMQIESIYHKKTSRQKKIGEIFKKNIKILQQFIHENPNNINAQRICAVYINFYNYWEESFRKPCINL